MLLKLIAVTDGQHSVNELVSIILEIHEKVDYIHIRENNKSASELLQLIDLLLQSGVDKRKIVIHDRLDLVLITGIPNIHLPGHGLPVKRVREKFPALRIGQSIHFLEEAKQAEQDGADYLLYGHVYETNCKLGKEPRGLEKLLEIKRNVGISVYAIGGITPEKMEEISKTNLDGVAVMSGIFSAEHPQQAAQRLLQKCAREVSNGKKG